MSKSIYIDLKFSMLLRDTFNDDLNRIADFRTQTEHKYSYYFIQNREFIKEFTEYKHDKNDIFSKIKSALDKTCHRFDNLKDQTYELDTLIDDDNIDFLAIYEQTQTLVSMYTEKD